ncbi:hypothetical protein Tco_1472280, partial [Tanacetum coccineum]
EASSKVTYTSISSYYEEPSDKGSPRVVVYGYDGLPMHPVDPPLSDYVSGPEEPEQAPLSLDYVPRPKYPKYLAPSDEKVHVDSPMALSSGYIADSDPKEDPEDESEDGLVDYPTDRRDDDDDSSGDDADDEDEEEDSDEDEDEEHLAYADSTADASLVTPIPIPFEAKVDRLLAIPTPPPSPLTPLSSPLPQIPSPPLPVPSPLTTSLTYAEAPLGLREAKIRLRTASPLPSPTSPPTYHPLPSPLLPPLVDRREDIPEADIPPQKRLCLIAPIPRFEVGKSLAVVATKHPGLEAARTTNYDFADMEGAPTTLEGVNARVTELAETNKRDTQDLYAHLEDAQDI